MACSKSIPHQRNKLVAHHNKIILCYGKTPKQKWFIKFIQLLFTHTGRICILSKYSASQEIYTRLCIVFVIVLFEFTHIFFMVTLLAPGQRYDSFDASWQPWRISLYNHYITSIHNTNCYNNNKSNCSKPVYSSRSHCMITIQTPHRT